MITINFNVTETDVSIISCSDEITSGCIGVIHCEFNLPITFNGLVVKARFNGVERTIVNGVCDAPELRGGTCEIGVVAGTVDDDGNIIERYSPRPCKKYIYRGSAEGATVTEPEVPQSEYDAFVLLVQNMINSGNLKGQDGIGISSAVINDDGELILTYSNGSSVNLGVVKGADGTDAPTDYYGLTSRPVTNQINMAPYSTRKKSLKPNELDAGIYILQGHGYIGSSINSSFYSCIETNSDNSNILILSNDTFTLIAPPEIYTVDLTETPSSEYDWRTQRYTLEAYVDDTTSELVTYEELEKMLSDIFGYIDNDISEINELIGEVE